ncbi:lipoprotein [Streptomyces roseochromogenus]|nr:lipoprotein [Streptomyces roseochromogenus]
MHRVPAAMALAAVLAGAAGCADVEGIKSEGDLGTVHAPKTLWKDVRPEPPAKGQQPGAAATVPGLPKAPALTMRGVDALAVVRADITSATAEDGGTGRLVDPRAARRLALCTGAADGGPDCPVRPGVLHDLTGDGREELITALDVDGRLSELRVYTVRDDGRIARILARRGVLEGVEVAAEHLAVREPTTNPRYSSVSDYVWDAGTGSMSLSQLTLDECAALTDVPLPGNRSRCAR